jgi:hypothetical protein
MTRAPSSSNLFGLALILLAVGACSAEASSPPSKNPNNENKAGSGGSGTGGLPNTAGSGGTGNMTPTGGTGNMTPTGGASGSGTGGMGTGGGGALTACPSPPAAGALADVLIDDMEDNDNGVAKVGSRSGFWYTFLDAYGSTIIPAPDKTGTAPLKPGMTDCHGGTACMIVSGTTAPADETAVPPVYPYAGIGFDFSNAKKPCVYNGTAYTGIKFWARGDVPIRVKVNTSGTADAGGGGTCTLECNNAHGLDVVLSPTWAEVDLPFATIAQEAGWGTVVAFDKASLLSVQIQIPAGQIYNAAFDDFTFY